MNEIPLWAALTISFGVGLLLIGLLLVSINGANNAQRKRASKREADTDAILFELPTLGYNDSGRRNPTALESQVESDPVSMEKIERATDDQKKNDLQRKRTHAEKSGFLRKRFS